MCLVLFAVCAGGFVAPLRPLDAGPEVVPALNPARAQLLGANRRWSVWLMSERLGDPRHARRRTQWVRICRQRIGATEAEVIFETYGGRVPRFAEVLLDGTVLVQDRGKVQMIDAQADQKTLTVDLPDGEKVASVFGAVEQGVVVQTLPGGGRGKLAPALVLVPFRDGGLDAGKVVRLTEPGRKKARGQRVGSVLCRGRQVAWFNGRQLNVFDVRTGRRREVRLRGASQRGEVVAFDDRFVVMRDGVWDMQAGGNRVVKGMYASHAVVLRNGLLMRLAVAPAPGTKELSLVLTVRDLTAAKPQDRTLRTWPVYAYRAGGTQRALTPSSLAGLAMFGTEAGLYLFDGRRWTLVPYPDRSATDESTD